MARPAMPTGWMAPHGRHHRRRPPHDEGQRAAGAGHDQVAADGGLEPILDAQRQPVVRAHQAPGPLQLSGSAVDRGELPERLAASEPWLADDALVGGFIGQDEGRRRIVPVALRDDLGLLRAPEVGQRPGYTQVAIDARHRRLGAIDSHDEHIAGDGAHAVGHGVGEPYALPSLRADGLHVVEGVGAAHHLHAEAHRRVIGQPEAQILAQERGDGFAKPFDRGGLRSDRLVEGVSVEGGPAEGGADVPWATRVDLLGLDGVAGRGEEQGRGRRRSSQHEGAADHRGHHRR